ncbi:hypothetical protein ACJX0J_040410, partial [Zea mays]
YNKLNQIFRGGEPHIPSLGCSSSPPEMTDEFVAVATFDCVLLSMIATRISHEALCFVFLNFNNALPIILLFLDIHFFFIHGNSFEKKLSVLFGMRSDSSPLLVAIRAQMMVLLIDIAFNLHYIQ